MMKRRLAGLLLSAGLIAQTLCGCGASSDSSSADNSVVADETNITGDAGEITILYPGEETPRFKEFLENEFADKVKEDIGLKVNMVWLPWDQYWNQKEIMLAANDEIDLYWDGLTNLASIVNKGQAQPITELVKTYCPDMMKVYPEERLKGATIDGEVYGIPSAYGPTSCISQLVCAREDLLNEVGMTDLKTPEDLKEFAKKVKEAHPELKGPADIIFKPLTRYYQDEQLTWVSGNEIAVLGEESGKIYSYYETDAFKQVAEFNAGMYKDGLYTDELTTQYNEKDARMQTGLHLWVEGSIGKDQEIIGNVRSNAPDAQLKTFLLAPEKDKYITTAGGEVLCVPYSAKNPSGAMKFLNWLYSSPENYRFCIYGVEGKDYEMDGDRVNRICTEDFFYEWMFRNKNYQVFASDVPQEYIDQYMSWDDNAKTSSALGFVFNNEKVAEQETAINELITTDFASIRTGFAPYDENYEAALAKLKAAGIDEYIAEVQRQYDEFIAAQK
ncbi:MAG: extracellular solute-binding protein [Pseudobutyrivibrio sp.]|nr:extracellular solute-binding protein [Pseudobutyrivibrio sp.]